MQTREGHQEYMRLFKIPQQKKAIANEKEHSRVVSFEEARLKKMQHQAAPECPVGNGHKAASTRPGAREIHAHKTAMIINDQGNYECPECMNVIAPELVNFN